MPVYVIILAALLLVRAGGLAWAGWSDRQDARDEAASQAARSGTVQLKANRALFDQAYANAIEADYQRALERAMRDAGHYGCGCSPDRSGGQAGAAGF